MNEMPMREAVMRLHVERLRKQVDELEARADELAFARWREDTVMPEAVERWTRECGE